MVRVVVDSTADIPPAIRDELEISVVPLMVQFGDQSYRDGVDLTNDQFYARLAGGETFPKTSQPAPGAFLETYQQLAPGADGIISIHISPQLSGTYTSAEQATAMLDNARVTLVDSTQTALSQGFLAIMAARAAREGKSLPEIEALVRSLIPRIFIYAGLDTLKYLERGGRIGRMRAFLGTLLNVKPILEVRSGEVHPIEQVRTSKRLPLRMMELARQHQPIEQLAVLYTSDPTLALDLVERCVAAALLPRDKILLAQMGPVIGTHVGPGAIGIAGIGVAR